MSRYCSSVSVTALMERLPLLKTPPRTLQRSTTQAMMVCYRLLVSKAGMIVYIVHSTNYAVQWTLSGRKEFLVSSYLGGAVSSNEYLR
jgi:hypothetical protein